MSMSERPFMELLEPRRLLDATGLFNNDASPDLVWHNTANGQVAIWYLNGTFFQGAKTLSLATNPALGWRLVGAADFNGNGKPDLLWQRQSTGQNAVWFLGGADGSTIVGTTLIQSLSDTNWRLSGPADFNGDDQPDLLWRHQTDGRVALWYLGGANGVQVLSTFVLAERANNQDWHIGGVGNLNMQDAPDIIWRNSSTGANAVWFLKETSNNVIQRTGVTNLQAEADQNWRLGGLGDFDFDGTPDLVWRNVSNGNNRVWRTDPLDFSTIGSEVTLRQASNLDWKLGGQTLV